ncbi:MAG: hypothetical protein ACMVY4_11485 [Minwuia sp.]|uniref:hypothetical protein n=1 Tax=Minwuia sp. TaxID=2493630 RepID=UPI003A8B35D3
MNDICGLLRPDEVVFGCGHRDDFDVLPAELQMAAGLAAGRRLDFLAGRTAARSALTALGAPRQPVSRGSDGRPVPEGPYILSIAHDGGRAYAIAANRSSQRRGIGLDIIDPERAAGMDFQPVLDRVASPDEPTPKGAAPAALFSAKEAALKALVGAGDAAQSLWHLRLQYGAQGLSAVSVRSGRVCSIVTSFTKHGVAAVARVDTV